MGADRVRDAVAELLGVSRDSVAVDVPFRELGVDSAGVAGLATRLDVPVWAVWQCPTVAALGAFLDGDETTPPPTGAARRSGVEPVAIVGLGCRLPGGISSPDGLWSALLSEVDAVGPVPAGRWDADEWFDADPAAPGKTTTRRGGFLDDVAGFDADFFRISPAEAERMDPQQRIALEVAWSALEDARVVPGELAGTRTGVFFGTMWQEYHLATGADPATVGPQSAVGWDTSIVPSRIAYALGLQGPVLSVGSACSSSLGAVHLAAHSLRRGESDLVLAGGVNLMLHPHTTVAMTKFGGLNPAGQCRAFDAGAAGYVRGEGCAVVVLRRLSDALRDGDRIYAVLLGSAVNNDGASNGLTAPNPRAQVDVLRSAWHEAGVPAHRVSYVEAHGTGTPLGDVIEASALGEVFGPDRTEPLRVGSAKTNFGHLEPAAGVLGVLKTALALYHGELPASLHFDVPNPGIDFAALRLSVVAGRQAWPAGFRYAGVSGFGFGGTNVHVALAQPPYRRRVPVALAEDSAEALAARVADLDWSVPTLPTRTGPHRAVAWHDGGATTIRTGSGARRPVAFCFSGHGAQWAGMGRDLLAEPAFRAALTEVDAALAPLTGWSVVTELLAEQPRFDRTDVVQPALFAVQVALTRTLSAWGVVPDVVFGQSVGEVAAAVAAGALTLDQGARLITVWSRLVAERADGTGTVLVCAMSEVDAAPLVRGRLTTAAILADGWTCLSGPNDAIADVAGDLTDAGVRVHRVDIGYPAHSGGLAALVPELVERLGDLRPTPAAVPFVSTVTGAFVAGTGLDAKYWARNMCAPMLVADAVRALPTGCRIVEIGPHPVLRAQLAGMTDDDVLATCHREKAGRQTMEDLVADLWLDGATVDWPAVAGVTPAADAVPLPLSAATETGLRAQAAAVRAHLRAHPELSPADIGYSLATTRTAFDHRAVLLARDHTDAGLALTAVADGTTGPGVITGTSTTVDDAGPVFVFPGQGSQWTEMARDLLDAEPAFAARFAGCADALAEFVDWDPAAALADDDLLARADVVQPVLWAVMVSLAALWEAHGVRPAAVVGHSQGEIAAATVAGGLSIRDAALVVALRGKIIARELSGSGGMMSVPLSRDEIAWRLADWHAGLSVAAEIGPRATVVAGSAAALAVLVARCHAEGITVRRVAIDYPSHSAGVDPVADEVVTTLAPIRPGEGHVPYLSTVTGAPLATTALDAAYWYRNLRAPVELRAAVEQLIALGHRVFVEVSPHPVLTAGIADTGAALGVDVVTVGTLRRGAPGVARFRTSLAEAHVRGVAVDWRPAFPAAHTVDLPAYSFQHRRYWLGGNRPAATADTDFWDAVERGDLTGLGSALDLPADATLADLLPALAEWRRRTRPEPPHQEAEEAGPGFAERLAERPPGQRHDLVLDVVLRHIAAVLGYGPGEWPDADRAFRELGFDSVTGVQLRNRLGAELGIELPSTLVYDHPAPAALADHLLTGLGFGVRPAEQAPPERIEDASDDELFQFIDNITSRRAS